MNLSQSTFLNLGALLDLGYKIIYLGVPNNLMGVPNYLFGSRNSIYFGVFFNLFEGQK